MNGLSIIDFILGFYYGFLYKMYEVRIKINKFIPLKVFKNFIITYLFLSFLGFRFLVPGTVDSMFPNYEGSDFIIYNKISKFNNYERGDVVLSESTYLNKDIIKRIVGLPGEIVQIKNGQVYINEEPIKEDYIIPFEDETTDAFLLGENEYFLIGDNRPISYDSRSFGPVKKIEIEAKVLLKIPGIAKLIKKE